VTHLNSGEFSYEDEVSLNFFLNARAEGFEFADGWNASEGIGIGWEPGGNG
jgi:hypothetical protein